MAKDKNQRSQKEEDFFLIQEALCGNQRAYTQIFNKYKGVVTFYISKFFRDKDTINDVLMECFEKAFRNLKSFEPNYPLSTWIIRIGINRSIDHRNEKFNLGRFSLDELFSPEEDSVMHIQIPTEDRTDEAIEREQEFEYVGRKIDQLKAPYKDVMRMLLICDFTFEEIADELKISVEEAKSLVHKGRKQLLKLIHK